MTGDLLPIDRSGANFSLTASSIAALAVTNVTASAPLVSSGGLTPNISLSGFTSAGNGASIVAPFGIVTIPPSTANNSTLGTTKSAIMVAVTTPITIRNISFNVVTNVGGAKFYAAIYDSSQNLVPNSSNGGASLASIGAVSTTLGTPVPLNPGIYWIFYQPDTTGAVLTGINVGGSIVLAQPPPTNTNVVRAGNPANGISGSAVPASLGGVSSGTVVTPYVMFEA